MHFLMYDQLFLVNLAIDLQFAPIYFILLKLSDNSFLGDEEQKLTQLSAIDNSPSCFLARLLVFEKSHH